MSKQIIGISGVAGSGKDTFLEILLDLLPNAKRFALADALKEELNPFFNEMYGVDIFTCDRDTKDDLRPILVAHGHMRRKKSSGTHWTSLLEKKIKDYVVAYPGTIPVVTDIRYDIFPRDEVSWLRSLGGTLVHIRRFTNQTISENGQTVRSYILPPNEHEKLNDPKLISRADFKIEWPTVKDSNGLVNKKELQLYVEEFLKYYNR